jgi:tetratricopeptide (TPR) repeat protein
MTAAPHALRIGMAAALLAVALAARARAVSQAEREFIWDEANSRMAAAASPRDFMAAAAAYQKLVDLNVRNRALFYNLGTALLNAERYDDALEALSRAERYGGGSPDISRNLQIAQARKAKLKETSASWDRVLIFWHYGLPLSARAWLAVFAFAAFWLGLTGLLIGRRRAGRAMVAASLVLLALFGSSVAVSLHQESNAPRPMLDGSAP